MVNCRMTNKSREGQLDDRRSCNDEKKLAASDMMN